MSRPSRRNYFKPALVREKVAAIRVHDLRHTAASLWLAAGFPPYQVSRWLGHASVVTTDAIYSHLYPRTTPSMSAASRLSRDGRSPSTGRAGQPVWSARPSAPLLEAAALRAQRLATGAVAVVLTLDVVAGVAVSVVVVDVRQDRVPREVMDVRLLLSASSNARAPNVGIGRKFGVKFALPFPDQFGNTPPGLPPLRVYPGGRAASVQDLTPSLRHGTELQSKGITKM